MSVARADEPPLTAFVNHLSYRHRSGAPSMVDITLNQPGGDHLRGRLHVDVIGFDTLARLESGELTLTGGTRKVRLMLPPLNANIGMRTLDLRMRFVGEDLTIDLGTQSLPMPDRVQRSLVVAICDDSGSTVGSSKVALGQSLRLERFVPASRGRNALVTWPAMLTPAQLPVQPAGYCCYDIVVLLADGFARAEGRQLEALKQWVEAGGSLLVMSDGSGLEARHLDFLNALAARDAVPRQFGLKSGGGLLITPALMWQGTEFSYAVNRCELGRCVVVAGPMPGMSHFSSESWLQTAAFLWRVHAHQLTWVRGNPGATLATHLDSQLASAPPPPTRVDDERPYDSRYETSYGRRDNDLSLHDGEEVSWLTALLMPRNVKVIPFGTVVLILLGFTAVIGPLDYFVLGMLRGRRFTWITFPVMCVAFTFITVKVANQSMGQADRGKTLVINDVGGDGRVLRQARFELAFAGREVVVETRMTGGLYAPVNTFGFSGHYDYRGYDDEDNPGSNETPPVYTGWLSGQHTVKRVARQWTPTMSRITAIAPPTKESVGRGDALSAAAIDWQAVEAIAFDEGVSLDQLRRAMKVDASVSIALLRKTGLVCDPSFRGRFDGYGDPDRYDTRRRYAESSSVIPSDFPPLLSTLCLAGTDGIWSIVGQVSPHGSGAREDMALVWNDEDSISTPTLFVVREVGEQIVVDRRRCVKK